MGVLNVSYNCVVCVKQVPDTKKITGQTMKDDGTVNRSALPAVFNPEDLHALEASLAIRDQYGGTVTVVTMGLPKACETLRESLYRGADRAILITDRKAAGSDTLATSYILACAVRKLDADLVFCGRQAIDGDTAQVGPQLAEKLGFNLMTYMDRLMLLEDSRITLRRNLGNGWEVVSGDLPALVTVTESANTPRPQAAKKMMKYKKARSRAEIETTVKTELGKEADDHQIQMKTDQRCKALEDRGLLIEQWSLADLDADLNWCGMRGSPTKVNRVQSIVLAGGDYKQFEPTDEGMARLVNELIEEHTIG